MAEDKNSKNTDAIAKAEGKNTDAPAAPKRNRRKPPASVQDFVRATSLEGNTRSGAPIVVGGLAWSKVPTTIPRAGISEECLCALFDHPDLDIRVAD